MPRGRLDKYFMRGRCHRGLSAHRSEVKSWQFGPEVESGEKGGSHLFLFCFIVLNESGLFFMQRATAAKHNTNPAG